MSAPVDVLAVIDLAADRAALIPELSEGLKQARSAVAELIEVAGQFDSYKSSDFGDTSILDNEELWDQLSSALARVKGA